LLGWKTVQLERKFLPFNRRRAHKDYFCDLPSQLRLEFVFHHVIEDGHCFWGELKREVPI
jgi:hypothetical protein